MLKEEWWIPAGLLIVLIAGLSIDVMDIDAAQYASMSREMMEGGNYLKVYDLGKDYLDKPPFLFWISAPSLKIFGTHTFAYKLPSFLFALVAVYSTFRLASVYYSRRVAFMAAAILASSQGFILMNHDVRADTVLMGWVTFSLWQLAEWFRDRRFIYFVFACIGMAGGMMTKGPIALLIPVFAFGTQMLLQRRWKDLLRWEYLVGIIIIGILLIPMCIGLYQQFDLHPEKVIDGKTGVSGLRFFFWTQSFGRITGESEWTNKSNIFTLLQNMMWSFLPWIIFFLIGLVYKMVILARAKFRLNKNEEAVSLGGFLLTYLSLGLSNYQLPHYIFVVFPLASIISAAWLHSLMTGRWRQTKLYRFLFSLHAVIFCILGVALIFLLSIPFKTIPWIVPALAAAVVIIVAFMLVRYRRHAYILFYMTTATIITINIFLNLAFYPALMKYQMGGTAGRWIRSEKIPTQKTFLYKHENYRSLQFYAQGIIQRKDSIAEFQPGEYVITSSSGLRDFDSTGTTYSVLKSGEDFRVSKLTSKFLNPSRRPTQVSTYVIIKIN